MHTTKYLIVGAGMTGDMAAKGIREQDPDGSITMVGADPHPTYKRPLLTKGLWQGAPEEKLWREPRYEPEKPWLVTSTMPPMPAEAEAPPDLVTPFTPRPASSGCWPSRSALGRRMPSRVISLAAPSTTR